MKSKWHNKYIKYKKKYLELINQLGGDWTDYEYVLDKVSKDGENLSFASEELKSNPIIVNAALNKNINSIKHVSSVLLNDKKFIKEIVNKFILCFRHISKDFRADKEVILSAVSGIKNDGEYEILRSLISRELQDDIDIITLAVSLDGNVFENLSKNLKKNRLVVLSALDKNPDAFIISYEISNSIAKDREVVLKAVAFNENSLEFATDFQSDEEIITRAIKTGIDAFDNISPEFKNNEEFLNKVVKINGIALCKIDDKYKNYKLVSNAVNQDGNALQYATREQKCDERIVLEAINKNGISLRFADSSLRDKETIVNDAVIKNIDAIQHASKRIRSNPKIMIPIIKSKIILYKFAESEVKNDIELLKFIISNDSNFFKTLSVELRGNKEIVIEALSRDGLLLEYVPPEIQKDKEILKIAVTQNVDAFKFISDDKSKKSLGSNLLVTITSTNPDLYDYMPQDIKKNSTMINDFIQRNGLILAKVSQEFKKNREIVKHAISQNFEALNYADDELRSDREFILFAINIDEYAFIFADEALKHDPDFIYSAYRVNNEILQHVLNQDILPNIRKRIIKEDSENKEIENMREKTQINTFSLDLKGFDVFDTNHIKTIKDFINEPVNKNNSFIWMHVEPSKNTIYMINKDNINGMMTASTMYPCLDATGFAAVDSNVVIDLPLTSFKVIFNSQPVLILKNTLLQILKDEGDIYVVSDKKLDNFKAIASYGQITDASGMGGGSKCNPPLNGFEVLWNIKRTVLV